MAEQQLSHHALLYGVTYLKGCFRPGVTSAYMTRGFERPMVGPTPILEAMPHKTERKKLLITHRYGAYGVRIPRRRHCPILSPRVDHLAHLSRPERQRCSWGACRESDGRAAAQPPYAHAPVRRKSHGDAVLLRSYRSSKVPHQAASSLARPPEPPAELAAAKDWLVHGSAGRHQQLATLPSSSLRGATFDAADL